MPLKEFTILCIWFKRLTPFIQRLIKQTTNSYNDNHFFFVYFFSDMNHLATTTAHSARRTHHPHSTAADHSSNSNKSNSNRSSSNNNIQKQRKRAPLRAGPVFTSRWSASNLRQGAGAVLRATAVEHHHLSNKNIQRQLHLRV